MKVSIGIDLRGWKFIKYYKPFIYAQSLCLIQPVLLSSTMKVSPDFMNQKFGKDSQIEVDNVNRWCQNALAIQKCKKENTQYSNEVVFF